ncbi:MAG: response regulator [Oligoflexia bacterium]
MKTILVVDDEPLLREALTFDLKHWGYSPLEAENGLEALKVLKEKPVDLIVTDIRMPEMGGVVLLEQVRKKDPFLPVVIFITGYSDVTIEDAYDLGADAVFSKPFDRSELIQSIQRTITPPQERWRTPQSDTGASPEAWITLSASITLSQLGHGGFFLPDATSRTPQELRHQTLNPEQDIIRFSVDFQEPLPNASETRSGLQGLGKVRWTREKDGLPAGRGVEFLWLDPESLSQALQLIEKLRPRATIPKK